MFSVQLKAQRSVIDLLCQERIMLPDGAVPLPIFLGPRQGLMQTMDWTIWPLMCNVCRRPTSAPPILEWFDSGMGHTPSTLQTEPSERTMKTACVPWFTRSLTSQMSIQQLIPAVIAQDKFVGHLGEINERTAADWQRGEWTGENGRCFSRMEQRAVITTSKCILSFLEEWSLS